MYRTYHTYFALTYAFFDNKGIFALFYCQPLQIIDSFLLM